MKKLNLLVATIVFGFVNSSIGAAEPGLNEKEQAKSDQLRAAIQGICPISGEKLGGHGTPVKVKIGKEEVFLCCKACLKDKVSPKHWATIHANFAKAQKICPVMKKPLPAKGAKWTIVEGRIVYVCCPPCIAKIEAEPKTFLAVVDKQYAEYQKKEKEKK